MTPKRTTPSKSTTSKTQKKENDAQLKKSKIHSQETTRRGKLNDANQIRAEDLKMAATNAGTDNIDIAPENDDFEDAHVDVQTNDDDTSDTTGQGNIPAAPAAAGANGPASFNLRVEQNKIPEFFGAKSKDTISAADFI